MSTSNNTTAVTSKSAEQAAPLHSAACCKRAPVVHSDYTPKGAVETVTLESVEGKSMEVYSTGPANVTRAIIFIYDIFGFHPATFQVADLLSEQLKARVVMPDLLLGHAFDAATWTPQEQAKLGAWLQNHGGWHVVSPLLVGVFDWLALTYPATRDHTGMVGLCWGGKVTLISLMAFADHLRAGATPHPSASEVNDAINAKRPVLVLPSADEGEMADMAAVLAEKKDGSRVVPFPDMHHGFCGARADFRDEKNRQRTAEAVQLMAEFFEQVL
ncbi:hypothetical protein AMAG_00158 [Allomyces macrogynus ATCC 38327]|uniref:Dienelactone hydrolase domain-containing protein n=1 Tax=Allomyces macrogynus (strain ATCC 38327) TaxID=578462 RepID=A0A0L0RVQ2_ALLM3|nr:hypothetical protein AMAG_00158 [Allomyces macrogynus ATCC 38327]|eukprot:KNE54161.1 hypothetical protein AMAG_00158 [Allomyces macrogynus ATCC 38327]